MNCPFHRTIVRRTVDDMSSPSIARTELHERTPPSPEVTVEVFVDPSCPFAWITEQWLAEVDRVRTIELGVRLLSLSVVNDRRDIDPWYRTFNDGAWAPARVMAAVERECGSSAARRFYEAFGHRFHAELGTSDDADRVDVSRDALDRAGLPAHLLDAATDTGFDEHLRAQTARALESVGLDVGVPLVVVDRVAASGPVLSRIPRGDDASRLFDAVVTLAREPGFVRLERQRLGRLVTT
jgi:hypothetical protein